MNLKDATTFQKTTTPRNRHVRKKERGGVGAGKRGREGLAHLRVVAAREPLDAAVSVERDRLVDDRRHRSIAIAAPTPCACGCHGRDTKRRTKKLFVVKNDSAFNHSCCSFSIFLPFLPFVAMLKVVKRPTVSFGSAQRLDILFVGSTRW